MKKINDILTNYFSLNLLSILGNLSLLLILFYLFVLYPIAISNLPNNIDSFDVIYGIVMELCRIMQFINSVYLVLITFALFEFVLQRFIKYRTFKFIQSKIYVIFFYLGLLMTLMSTVIFVN